jgi:hypothetical protein
MCVRREERVHNPMNVYWNQNKKLPKRTARAYIYIYIYIKKTERKNDIRYNILSRKTEHEDEEAQNNMCVE